MANKTVYILMDYMQDPADPVGVFSSQKIAEQVNSNMLGGRGVIYDIIVDDPEILDTVTRKAYCVTIRIRKTKSGEKLPSTGPILTTSEQARRGDKYYTKVDTVRNTWITVRSTVSPEAAIGFAWKEWHKTHKETKES